MPTSKGLDPKPLAAERNGLSTAAAADEARDTLDGVGPAPWVDPDHPIVGRLDHYGDTDVFRATFVAGLSYTIELLGADGGHGTLADPLLTLFDAEGNQIDESDDTYDPDTDNYSFNSTINHDATESGTYLLRAGALFESYFGTYVLRVSTGLGGYGDDVVRGTGRADAVDGFYGADDIAGKCGADTLAGGEGDDSVSGGHGRDRVAGDAGDDLLLGGRGSDTLTGGFGSDTLIGGADADTFVFASGDATRLAPDFIEGRGGPAFQGVGAAAGDLIDLHLIDADIDAAGNQAFIFGGTGARHLTLTDQGSDTVVLGNTDGGRGYQLAFLIEDGDGIRAADYTAADFIL